MKLIKGRQSPDNTADRIVQGLLDQYLSRATNDQVLIEDVAEFLASSYNQMIDKAMGVMTHEAMQISHGYQRLEEDKSIPMFLKICEEEGLVIPDSVRKKLVVNIQNRIDFLLSHLITRVHARVRDDLSLKNSFSQMITSYQTVSGASATRANQELFREIVNSMGEGASVTAEELAEMITNAGEGPKRYENPQMEKWKDMVKAELNRPRKVANEGGE